MIVASDAAGLNIALRRERSLASSDSRASAAAVANAVYHATGIRVRDLPITLDKLPKQPA